MKGEVRVRVKNRHINFDFLLERNVTVITGDSGTGKTKLINMIRDHSAYGRSSGVTLTCKKPCIVLSGRDWFRTLSDATDSIVFVEESSSFLTEYDFAKAIQESDNYYVFVTREPLPQIPYSISEIKEIIKNDNKPKFNGIYKGESVKDVFCHDHDVVIVEDSKAGYEFFCNVFENSSAEVISSNGKSGILSLLNQHRKESVLVIADAAALGSEIREIVRFKKLSENRIDLFLPESFEWLILRSGIFNSNVTVADILKKPVNYIESREHFSWERFFTELLIRETRDKINLEYKKSKLAEGYLTDANISSILGAMKNKSK